MLMILVQWILHKIQQNFSQCRLGVELHLCTFWRFVSNSAFFKWQMSISEEKWTFAPFVLAWTITSGLFLIFVRFHVGVFSNFSHSWSTADFAAGIFIAWDRWMNQCVNFECCSELSSFPAIWSSYSFARDSSIRSRVDSRTSKIHAKCALKSSVLLRVSPYWLFLHVLQGTAMIIDVSSFFDAFLMISLNSLSSGSMK